MQETLTDEYGVVRNNALAALSVHMELKTRDAVSIALSLGNGTMFYITFVNLWTTTSWVPQQWEDGSNRGLLIGIDRHGCYSLPTGNPPMESGYLAEKWGLSYADAEKFLPFLQTVMLGENKFVVEDTGNSGEATDGGEGNS